MVDSHSKTFFGQNTGIIVSSFSSSDPFTFIHCFKKKPNGTWEKPSSKEGKTIKFSLEEVVLILRVLNRKTLEWQSHHNYKDIKTSISFNWENEETEVLWINIGKYSKRLTLAQTEIFRLLLSHFLHEKIIYSTFHKKAADKVKPRKLESQKINEPNEIDYNRNWGSRFNLNEAINLSDISNNMSDIDGSIVGETDKAFLIKFDDNEEWIPKSAIKNHSVLQNNVSQKFIIDNWILRKLNLIS